MSEVDQKRDCPYCSNSIEVWENLDADTVHCPHCGDVMPRVEFDAWVSSVVEGHLESQDRLFFPDPDDPQ